MAPDAGTRGVIETLPGSLPMSVVPDDVNPELVAVSCISGLHSLTDADFIGDALWKDLYALTGLPRTFSTAKAIETAWNDVSSIHKPFDFTFTPGTAEVVRKTPKLSWVEGRFTFSTKSCPASFCSGMVSLVPDGGDTWKIWILRTILERLEGHPDVDVPNPQTPIINWEANEFDCLVVGAGQCGLSTAGRLQSLGVNYLLIDKNDNIGDNWLLRYDSMKLHTVRAYAHLPFERTFPGDSYPELLSKYDLAKCYKLWADKFGINVWLSSQLVSGSWDKYQKKWNLVLRRRDGETRILVRHLVLATGAGGQTPVVPTFPGRENFRGLVLHSADYKSASQWKGKSAVVVGSANTVILPFEYYQQGAMSKLTDAVHEMLMSNSPNKQQARYNDTFPTNLADRIEYTTPLSIVNKMVTSRFNDMMSQDTERLDALERVGFRVKRCGNPLSTLYEEGGRHICESCPGFVKSDAVITGYSKDGFIFNDGSELKADIILLATGFEMSFGPTIARILGADVAAQLEEFWGLDEEGEVRGAWKPLGHPRLWYMGGPFGHSRFFSRFVSLQIKAELAGTPLAVYRRTPNNEGSVKETSTVKN
ncbi:flavin-containing monooxygenase [Histoplasma capsulatum var. duboisii H88]|uniref:Flavin-containing monooxygenase n=1 Tax=Ajellomyces capsulatus (strain H88) TaxID=544711 RepID=F0U842_AJEC8|nr:flavin-containing monooxygenase [Histoplasma capsulatum var. duboisii H88]